MEIKKDGNEAYIVWNSRQRVFGVLIKAGLAFPFGITVCLAVLYSLIAATAWTMDFHNMPPL